jgi:hypothetical protein
VAGASRGSPIPGGIDNGSPRVAPRGRIAPGAEGDAARDRGADEAGPGGRGLAEGVGRGVVVFRLEFYAGSRQPAGAAGGSTPNPDGTFIPFGERRLIRALDEFMGPPTGSGTIKASATA